MRSSRSTLETFLGLFEVKQKAVLISALGLTVILAYIHNIYYALQVFSGLFEKGKALQDDYFKDMGLDMENPAIEVEFQKHEAWKQRTQLKGTPTVLVNGYKLPECYLIEDLRYFTNLDL